MTDVLLPGVHNIMATPFLPDEELDLASIGTLIEYLVREGCTGVLALGVLGEADRLTEDEREAVLRAVLEHASGRLQVSVGISHQSTAVTAKRARQAEALGVAGVMVAPPIGSAAGPALKDHYRRIADGLSIPVIVQDHPASNGVRMPVEFIASLAEHLPPGSVVKLEEPPTAAKMARLRALVPAYALYGGLGGVSLLYELDAGAAGTMTGFALPSVLASIVSAHQAGDHNLAQERFERALPLLDFEAQPGVGVALRKELLRQQGAIAHASVRQPAPAADPFLLATLNKLLARQPGIAGAPLG
jgi:4-hydroxy-tetrahydrodipicolinate synthase